MTHFLTKMSTLALAMNVVELNDMIAQDLDPKDWPNFALVRRACVWPARRMMFTGLTVSMSPGTPRCYPEAMELMEKGIGEYVRVLVVCGQGKKWTDTQHIMELVRYMPRLRRATFRHLTWTMSPSDFRPEQVCRRGMLSIQFDHVVSDANPADVLRLFPWTGWLQIRDCSFGESVQTLESKPECLELDMSSSFMTGTFDARKLETVRFEPHSSDTDAATLKSVLGTINASKMVINKLTLTCNALSASTCSWSLSLHSAHSFSSVAVRRPEVYPRRAARGVCLVQVSLDAKLWEHESLVAPRECRLLDDLHPVRPAGMGRPCGDTVGRRVRRVLSGTFTAGD